MLFTVNKRSLFVIISTLLILIPHFINGRKSFRYFTFQNFDCTSNADFCRNYTAQISNDHQSVDLELYVVKDVPVDIWLQVKIAHRLTKNKGNFRNVLSYDFNLCDIIGRGTLLKNFNLINDWLNNVYKFTNMPRQCPIKKGFYYWRNFKPDKDSIPPFVLTGVYRIWAKFYMRDLENALFTNTTMLVGILMKEK